MPKSVEYSVKLGVVVLNFEVYREVTSIYLPLTHLFSLADYKKGRERERLG